MSDTWNTLAETHGRRAVMSLGISDAELDAETTRQIAWLRRLLAGVLNGSETRALDYGCGAGRFTAMLGQLVGWCAVGYDPCAAMIAQAPRSPWATFATGNWLKDGAAPPDVIFLAMVLGDPGVDIEETVARLVSILEPGGLFILIEHMDVPQAGRWWRMRPQAEYEALFARHGVPMAMIGQDYQLDVPITLMAGRRQR